MAWWLHLYPRLLLINGTRMVEWFRKQRHRKGGSRTAPTNDVHHTNKLQFVDFFNRQAGTLGNRFDIDSLFF